MRTDKRPRLQTERANVTGSLMTDDLSGRILAALQRIPDWLRRDLAASDGAARERAEEALAAIIGSALGEQPES